MLIAICEPVPLVSSCRWYEGWGHPNPHGTANLTSTLSPFTTLFHISVFFRAMCGSHENNGILQNSKALIYQELSHEPWAMSYLLPTFCSLGHRRQCYGLGIHGSNPQKYQLESEGAMYCQLYHVYGMQPWLQSLHFILVAGVSRLWYTCVACPDSMMKVAIIVYLL